MGRGRETIFGHHRNRLQRRRGTRPSAGNSGGCFPTFCGLPTDHLGSCCFCLWTEGSTPFVVASMECPSPSPSWGPEGDPTPGLTLAPADVEQRATLALVVLLLAFLAGLLVRCSRILLDPYSQMTAAAWSHHKERLDRGVLDPNLA
nr:cortexin-1 [Anolis sagrei ordinatus]